MGGKAEFVILAAGQGKLMRKGWETGGSSPELRGKRQVRQPEDASHAGQFCDVPEVGQDSVTDVDHGRYQA